MFRSPISFKVPFPILVATTLTSHPYATTLSMPSFTSCSGSDSGSYYGSDRSSCGGPDSASCGEVQRRWRLYLTGRVTAPDGSSNYDDYYEEMCTAATEQGADAVMQWLMVHRDEYFFRQKATFLALRFGDLHILQWLTAQASGCRWNEWFKECCKSPAEQGHLHILQWIMDQEDLACDKPDHYTYVQAARGGHLHIIQWLWQLDVPWHPTACSEAAKSGHPHILQWVRKQDPPCPWSEYVCQEAADGGHLHILQWLREQQPPCPWNEATCAAAAKQGNLDTLQWLREQNPPCPWNKSTCTRAAGQGKGQLEVLQWLREQNPPCPWGVETCAAAAQTHDLTVLQWLRAQEPACPWDATTCARAPSHELWRSQPNPHQVLAWALLHGCPAADPRHEKLRSQLVFLTCIKHQQKKRIYTRACKLGALFLSLPPDVIKYISELF